MRLRSVVEAGLACAAALLAACSRTGAPPKARSVLVVTLDTTRRDALSCYGGRPGLTPNLDQLAREGVAYDWARTPVPLTLPAHGALLTGLYPPCLTVHLNSLQALPSSATTLAERARAAGLETAAFVAAVVLDRAFGTDQGFDVYDQIQAPKVQEARQYASRKGGEVLASARQWLERRDPGRPFFAWLHFFDAHLPYEPVPEDLQQRAGGDAYLAEVAYIDRCLGELFQLLREQDLFDSLLVIVTADHGEGLGEHGEETHGTLCYDSTLRIPLLVRFPGAWGAGRRESAPVSLVDIHPTVLEALDLPLTERTDGQSLYGKAPRPGRGIYFESLYGYHSFRWSQVVGWADERGKYIFSSRPEYYEPIRDPGEANNLIAARSLQVALAQTAIRDAFATPALERGAQDTVDGSMLGKLAQLGYASTGGGLVAGAQLEPLAAGDRPAPRSCISNYNLLQRASLLNFEQKGSAAAFLLKKVLETEPRNPGALAMYSTALIQGERFAEAVQPLKEALKWGDDWYGVRMNLGLCYDRLLKTDEALVEYERALEFEPDLDLVVARLAQIYEARGHTEKAEIYKKRLAELQAPP